MGQPIKEGHIIEQFKSIEGIDAIQAARIKNSTTPVMKIQLFERQTISYVRTDGVLVVLKNRAKNRVDIVIFGSNVMYDQQGLEIEYEAGGA